MKLQDGTRLDNIDPEELGFLDRISYRTFIKKVKKAIPTFRTGILAVKDALDQIKKLKSKKEEEKEKIIENIRKDIIKALKDSMDILIIEDENGEEETIESLETKSTEELLKLLEENIKELEKFVNGR